MRSHTHAVIWGLSCLSLVRSMRLDLLHQTNLKIAGKRTEPAEKRTFKQFSSTLQYDVESWLLRKCTALSWRMFVCFCVCLCGLFYDVRLFKDWEKENYAKSGSLSFRYLVKGTWAFLKCWRKKEWEKEKVKSCFCSASNMQQNWRYRTERWTRWSDRSKERRGKVSKTQTL